MVTLLNVLRNTKILQIVSKLAAKYEDTYEVRRDGELRFRGTESECYMWLQKHTSCSADWAGE